MLCSEWVPSEWESDKNITIIHSPSVITAWEDKRCVCETLLPSDHCLQLKYRSTVLDQERNLHRSSTIYKLKQSKTADWGRILMWETTGDGLFLWKKSYYGIWSLSRKQQFEVKTSCWISFSFSLLQMLTDGLECCRLSWCLHQLLGRFEQMFSFKWTIPLRMDFCTENGYGFIRSVLRVYFMFISCCQKWFVSHHCLDDLKLYILCTLYHDK